MCAGHRVPFVSRIGGRWPRGETIRPAGGGSRVREARGRCKGTGIKPCGTGSQPHAAADA